MEDDKGSHVREIRNINSSENNSRKIKKCIKINLYFISALIIPTCTAISDHKPAASSYMPVFYTETSTDQDLLKRINDDDMIQHILSRPDLLGKLLSNLRILPSTVPMQQQLPYSTQLQMNSSTPQILFPYQQQSSPVPFQVHSQQPSSSITPYQMTNGDVCQQWPVDLNDVPQTFQTSENDLTESNSSSDDIYSSTEVKLKNVNYFILNYTQKLQSN